MTAFATLVLTVLDGSPVVAQPIPHTLRFATAEEVATLNPDLNTQTSVMYLSQMTAAYAFRLDHRNRLSPELATVVPTVANGGITKDGKTITLRLRRGVRWSDGQPFTADDVAFTIAAMNEPANNVPTRQGFDQIARVDARGRYVVVVHLRKPFGAIVPTLFASNNGIAILPKHILGRLTNLNNAPFNGLPVGIGPFRYAAWRRGDQIELERNPFYWRGQPLLEHVVMKLIPDRNTVLTQLQTGEIDLFYPFGGAYLSRVKSLPNVHIIRQPGYAVNEMLMNVKAPALADTAVRKALRYAVDRRLMREKVGHGVGVLQNVVVPTVDPSTPKDIPFTEFSLSTANAILDAAGWKRGADGIRSRAGTRLSVEFVTTTGTPDVDTLLELVRSWWTQIGVELNVRRYNAALLFGPFSQGGIVATGKFDIIFWGETLSAPFDITLGYGCRSWPPTGQNYAHYCNPSFDAVAARYDQTSDEAERTKLLARALHIIDRDALVIVTTGREDLYGVNNAVKAFQPNAGTPFDDMMQVDVGT